MRSQRHCVKSARTERGQRLFSKGLDRVCVEKDTALSANGAQLRYGLAHAGFVVRAHHGNERRLRRQRILQTCRIEPPVRIHGQHRDRKTFAHREPLKRVQHRMMFGRASDDVFPTPIRRTSPSEAEDCEIVGLGAAAGENDLVRLCAQESGELIAGIVNRRASPASSGVDGRRVSMKLVQKRPHRREDFWGKWGGRVVVEVDHLK